MSYDYTIYEVTATPLTPLHIGSGQRLMKDYDYAARGNQTWRLDENAILAAQDVSDPAVADHLARRPPAELLRGEDFRPDSPFFRYTMAGAPRSQGEGAQLQELLKTVNDEVYLPGSSLKGAIRTALAWVGWAEKQIKADRRELERNRQFAGARLEREIMGSDPNHDLLRALHVSDSAPAGKDRLLLVNVQVVTRGSMGSPIELEAIQPDTPFQLTIKVDRALFNHWARQNRLQLGGNPDWLNRLPELIQAHTRQRVEAEQAWFSGVKGGRATAGFYRQLLNAQLPAGSCLLQIGWGSGWADKTYGSHLQADGDFMEYIISTYNLARGRRQKGDPFPKSRRTTVTVQRDRDGRTQPQPGIPLGWVLLELKERK